MARTRATWVALSGLAGAAIAVTSCSSDPGPGSAPRGAPDHTEGTPSTSAAPAAAPPRPPRSPPRLPAVDAIDRDGDKIDDQITRRSRELVEVTVVLTRPAEAHHLDAFLASGGAVHHVFRAISYGWTGAVRADALPGIAANLGADLHAIVLAHPVVLYLDEATRTGRVRPAWAANYLGFASGFEGASDTTIAFLDTGIDGTHTDLAGRMAGWKDYTPDAHASPIDAQGHGSHVAGIATGTGAAFGTTSGTATLVYTDSATLAASSFSLSAQDWIHQPSYFGGASPTSISATATFLMGSSASMTLNQSVDGSGSSFGSGQGGPSPLTVSGTVTEDCYAPLLFGEFTSYAIVSSVSNYPAVGDGFSALRGVAPGCSWWGDKVVTDTGSGPISYAEAALDDLVADAATNAIKVVNMSLGESVLDPTSRALVNTAVDDGMVVVVAAGNNGPSGTIVDPALAALAITVGASNDINQLTSYSSGNPGPPVDSSEDYKPDLLAPGGSTFHSFILSVDSNTDDAQNLAFPDVNANDYTGLMGTSMAAPFVSGSAALVIQALEASGTTWSFGSSAQPLLVKSLLLMTSTETNQPREFGEADGPTLGRAAAPKDAYEGYGLINTDAAIEAVMRTFDSTHSSTGTVNATNTKWEARAWAYNAGLDAGGTVTLNLQCAATGDWDLYLYSGVPGTAGNPVVRTSSTNAGVGVNEAISFTSQTAETAYIVVKLVSGTGEWTMNGTVSNAACGNGTLDTDEQCDPGIAGTDGCCTSGCMLVTSGTACTDGNDCHPNKTCGAGICQGGTITTCPANDQCHKTSVCDPGTGVCSNDAVADGTTCTDGNACTVGDTCQSGVCASGSTTTCAASDQCHVVGACDTSSGKCSNPRAVDGTGCADGNLCDLNDVCSAGVCIAGSTVTCTPSDACHVAGACSTSTGQCSNPTKTDGTPCTGGTCASGACTPTDAGTDSGSSSGSGSSSSGSGSSSSGGVVTSASDDGGSAATGGVGEAAGCGCRAAGAPQRTNPRGALVILFGALVMGRRAARRRRRP